VIAIRPALDSDRDAVWAMLEPVIRPGDVFALPRDMEMESALAYWFAKGHWVFVAEEDGRPLGSYYLRANQQGGGSHVSNCGYVTAQDAGGRGVAGVMCRHSLEFGKSEGFRAMQFNFVVSTNVAAVHLWLKSGFEVVGKIPQGFLHPVAGYVDVLVMFREL
jgi:RimJ/RimL family protein N-acetyltransferase